MIYKNDRVDRQIEKDNGNKTIDRNDDGAYDK